MNGPQPAPSSSQPAAGGPVPPTASGSQRFQSGSQHVQAELPSGARFPLAAGFARVERVLGRGGMGVVYLVHDDRLGRRAALKLTRGRPSPRRALRFQREVLVTAGLDHPNIPPVYEAGRTREGQDYLLLRYVDGEPFSELLATLHADAGAWERDAAPRRLVGILIKVCEAVAYAHRQGVVHRDLKPENLMVGAFGEVLVMDWGLARVLSEDAEIDRKLRDDLGFAEQDQALTQAGAVLGTAGFMPPEQAQGIDVTPRADVFSLGAILCQALTGELPFTGASGMEVLLQTRDGEITIPTTAHQVLSPELLAICRRALESRPEDRYPDAATLAEDLRAWLEGRPVSVYTYRPVEQALRLIRANPALFSAIAVAFLGVLAAAVLMVWTRASTLVEVRVAGLDQAKQAAAETWDRSRADTASQALDERVGLALSALQAAQRWRTMAPDSAPAAEAQHRAAVALGELAQAGEQWALARQAFAQARGLGVDDAGVEVRLRQLEEAETQEAERKRTAVRAILAAVERGAYRDRSEGLTDAVFHLVRYPGPQTIELLVGDLDALGAELLQCERDAYEAVALPNEEETRRGEAALDQLGEAWARRHEGAPLSAAQQEALDLAERRLLVRASPHARMSLAGNESESVTVLSAHIMELEDVLASHQTSALTLGELDRLEVLSRALGRLGRSPVAVAGLGRYLAVERDAVRAARAVRSLCELADDAALSEVLKALARWAAVEDFVPQVGPRLGAALAGIETRDAPPAARRGVIQALQRGGDLEAALREADRLLSDAPEDVRALELRAQLLLAQRRYPAAQKTISRALELAPRDGRLLAQRARVLLAQDKLSAALAAATKSLEVEPNLPGGWLARAETRAKAGNWVEAELDLEEALRVDPEHVPALTQRAQVRLRLSHLDHAEVDAERATALQPWSPPGWALLGRIRAQRRDFAGAQRALSRAVEIDPSHAEAVADLGLVRAMQGEVEAGRLEIRRALELAPSSALAWLNLASVERLCGDFGPAQEALDKAIQLEPARAESWLVKGELHLQQGDLPQAISHLNHAIELGPLVAVAWNNRGLAKVQSGDLRGGVSDLDRAIELDPLLFEAWCNRGFAHSQLDHPKVARADLERATRLSPSSAMAWNNLAQIRWKLKDREAALAAARRAAELDPQLGLAHYNLGTMLLQTDQPEAARAALERAVETSAGIARAWSELAEALLLCDEPAAALDRLDEAKRQGHTRTRDIYVRGACLGLTGKRAQALKLLRRYVKESPQGRYVEQARAYIAQFQAERRGND